MRRMRRKHTDDIFDQMENLFQEFHEMGSDLTGKMIGAGNIPVDITEENGSFKLQADLPGVSKEDINLKVDSETAEISAESSHEVTEENEKYYRQERNSRSFRRAIRWPSAIDPETVHAEFNEGVLTVTADKEKSDGHEVEIE